MARKKRRSKQFKDSSKIIDMEQARRERQERRQKAAGTAGRVKYAEGPRSPESSARHNHRRRMLRQRQKRRRAIIVAAAAVLAVAIGVSFGQILMLRHDLHTAQKQQEEYRQEKEQLEKDMAELNDLDYLEEQARDQMRLIKPGETLYIFPEEMKNE
ncbi:MAG: septum formation initiator family protein [Bacillota bacterium]|nr:septum formation initiator family protein [Bacillota bacterium]